MGLSRQSVMFMKNDPIDLSSRGVPSGNTVIESENSLMQFYTWLPSYHPTRRLIERFLRGEPYVELPGGKPPSPPGPHRETMLDELKQLKEHFKGRKER